MVKHLKCKIFLIFMIINYSYTMKKIDKKELIRLREEVKTMFQHAYESYLTYAYPYDELRPLSCDGVDTWGSYSLTLIDALDTLAVMGNYTEFRRVVQLITDRAENFFDANINVSVFETNIRIIGGLLSAHLLSQRAGIDVPPGWPCNGPLLALAEEVARRLLPAFDTATGMPYGTCNLRHGVPPAETAVTCTAGVGTYIVEFGTLSRLTGDPLFEEVAMHALRALYAHRSALGLLGNHIDVQSGRWTAHDSGIGAGVDSYFEYLAKGALLLQRPELMDMFVEGRQAIDKYLRKDDWHVWVSMAKGQVTLPVFQSLEAYWPGVLSLIGDSATGMKSLHNYHQVWRQYGFTPEFYNIAANEAGTHREGYPLRPELAESVMYLHRATGDPYLLEVGRDILRSIQHSARTPCGYATIKDVRDHRKEDRMESFFLAETTKYLYLLFDPDNFVHNRGQKGRVVRTPWGECILDAGGYIFNTEAHPIDPGALQCCTGARHVHLQEMMFAQFTSPRTFSSRGDPLPRNIPVSPKTTSEAYDTYDIYFDEENADSSETSTNGTNEKLKIIEHLQEKEKIQEENNSDIGVVKVTKDDLDKLEAKEETNLTEDHAYRADDSDRALSNELTTNSPLSSISTQTLNPSITPEEISTEGSSNNLASLFSRSSSSSETSTSTATSETTSTKPEPEPFDPQRLLERLRDDFRFPRNGTLERAYHRLTCAPQPFLQRISLSGEIFVVN